jgi:CBS domain-containing protein
MERNVTVQEVMDREYVGVSESDGLHDAVELMLAEGTESVVVLRGSDPVGVVTERDALAAFVERDAAHGTTVDEAMTDEVPTVSPDATIGEVADRMSTEATKHVLVSAGDEPLGVLSEHDLITTSPFAPAVGAGDGSGMETTEAMDERTVAGVSAGRGEAAGEPAREYEDQSICEACGSLSRELSPFNGQLLCPDCRDI